MYPFDLYEGKGIPEGTRSLAFRLRFRAPERTLTDAEVDGAVDERACGAGGAARCPAPLIRAVLPADAPRRRETPAWERLEHAARGAASALGEWRRRALEAEHEVQRLRTELEQLTSLGPLPSDEAGDELRRLRAENAVLTSRAAEARAARQRPAGAPVRAGEPPVSRRKAPPPRQSVTVEIAGERHVLRSDMPPEYTRAVAQHVDDTLRALPSFPTLEPRPRRHPGLALHHRRAVPRPQEIDRLRAEIEQKTAELAAMLEEAQTPG